MSAEGSTVFLVGPPAAGKSTIGRAVADEFDHTFRTIDDWTPRGVRMTDEEVELRHPLREDRALAVAPDAIRRLPP